MKPTRLLPSGLDEIEETQKVIGKYGEPIILKLCAEVRACWAEIEQLRKIAIAAAEEVALSPATDSPLFEAVTEWQRSQREKP